MIAQLQLWLDQAPSALTLAINALWWGGLTTLCARLSRAPALQARRPTLLVVTLGCAALAGLATFGLLARALPPAAAPLLLLLVIGLALLSAGALRQVINGVIIAWERAWQRGDLVSWSEAQQGTIARLGWRHITLDAPDGQRLNIPHDQWLANPPALRYRPGMPWVERLAMELPSSDSVEETTRTLEALAIACAWTNLAHTPSVSLERRDAHTLRARLSVAAYAPQDAPALRAALTSSLLQRFPQARMIDPA